jgi:hypothetical protein
VNLVSIPRPFVLSAARAVRSDEVDQERAVAVTVDGTVPKLSSITSGVTARTFIVFFIGHK